MRLSRVAIFVSASFLFSLGGSSLGGCAADVSTRGAAPPVPDPAVALTVVSTGATTTVAIDAEVGATLTLAGNRCHLDCRTFLA